MTETVTIGDADVEIRETDDGFEAVEVEPEPEAGLYLRGECQHGNYGFQIRLEDTDAYEIKEKDHNVGNYIKAAWDPSADVADGLEDDGGARSFADDHGFDGHANLASFEIVEVDD